jgi:hypothetical protein
LHVWTKLYSPTCTYRGGVLFGFLLNISVRPAIISWKNNPCISVILIAVSLFVMPIIYHHVQFPYTDIDKFKRRAHRFILFGLVPTVTLYLGMILAFSPIIDTVNCHLALFILFIEWENNIDISKTSCQSGEQFYLLNKRRTCTIDILKKEGYLRVMKVKIEKMLRS